MKRFINSIKQINRVQSHYDVEHAYILGVKGYIKGIKLYLKNKKFDVPVDTYVTYFIKEAIEGNLNE